MTITHVFFDFHHTLIDPQRLQHHWITGLGKIMAERYGKEPSVWENAYRLILSDWDSYWADLNLLDDDGIDQMWEGWYRIHRGLFRITQTPAPPQAELTALSRELPTIAPDGNAFYPDALIVVNELFASGYQLGIITHALQAQVKTVLVASQVAGAFPAPIVTPDVVQLFDKNETYFRMACRQAQVNGENCVMVDDKALFLTRAKNIGMHTALIDRRQATLTAEPTVDWILGDTLLPILDHLASNLLE